MIKRITGIVCMLLGAFLLMGAGMLAYENQREENQAGVESTRILSQIQENLARENASLRLPTSHGSIDKTPDPSIGASPETDSTPIADEAIPSPTPASSIVPNPVEPSSALTNPVESTAATAATLPINPSATPSEMPTMKIDGNLYIGYIELPTLNLSLPVMSDWSYPQLRIAPCRYFGSVYDDTLVILAHNYARHFGSINKLSAGDPVQFVDASGNIYSYTVAKLETLEKYDVNEMIQSDYDLSLFTCTYGGKYRTTVRLNRIKTYV